MGAFGGKMLQQQDSPRKADNNSDLNNTSLKYSLTPPMKKRTPLMDPRSATLGIARTPIDVAATPQKSNRRVSAIPKRLQAKQYLETDMDETEPSPKYYMNVLDPRSPNVPQPRTPISAESPQHFATPEFSTPKGEGINRGNKMMSNLDPRSPALDFDRTPILEPKSPIRSRSSYEEQPNTWGDILYKNTPPPSRHSFCEIITSFDIPEIQAVLPDVVEDSEVPCFDSSVGSPLFIERLGVLEKQDSKDDGDDSKELSPIEKTDEKETEETLAASNNYVTLKSNVRGIIDNILITAMSNVELQRETVDTDKKIQIWRDTENCQKSIEKANIIKDIVIEFDDSITTIDKKQLPKVDPGMLENKICDVKHRRTPLGNRSNNHALIHGKSPQQLFRGKGNIGTSQQQENTPPTGKRFGPKLNGTLWDPDSTVVI